MSLLLSAGHTDPSSLPQQALTQSSSQDWCLKHFEDMLMAWTSQKSRLSILAWPQTEEFIAGQCQEVSIGYLLGTQVVQSHK